MQCLHAAFLGSYWIYEGPFCGLVPTLFPHQKCPCCRVCMPTPPTHSTAPVSRVGPERYSLLGHSVRSVFSVKTMPSISVGNDLCLILLQQHREVEDLAAGVYGLDSWITNLPNLVCMGDTSTGCEAQRKAKMHLSSWKLNDIWREERLRKKIGARWSIFYRSKEKLRAWGVSGIGRRWDKLHKASGGARLPAAQVSSNCLHGVEPEFRPFSVFGRTIPSPGRRMCLE